MEGVLSAVCLVYDSKDSGSRIKPGASVQRRENKISGRKICRLSPLARPPKRTQAQVNKDADHDSRHQKKPVIGPLRPIGSHTPKRGSKDCRRQKEKDAHHLQPYDAAHAAKGTQKSAHSARHDLGRSSRHASAYTGVARCLSSRRIFTGPSVGGHALASHTPGNSQPNAQSSPNLLRSHSVMMVAAALAKPLFPVCLRFAVDPGRQRK
jgi:hypothetical protein